MTRAMFDEVGPATSKTRSHAHRRTSLYSKGPSAFAGQAVAYALFALAIGYFASNPGYTRLPPDTAVIKLGFAHGAERKVPCRRLSAEELQALPPNMRRQEACSRERLPVVVELELDGEVRYRASLAPTGLARDGPSRVYQRIEAPAGPHRLAVRLRDSRRRDGFDHERVEEVELAPGQSFAIGFRPETGGFVFE